MRCVTYQTCDRKTTEDESKQDSDDIQDEYGLPSDIRGGGGEEEYGDWDEQRREDGLDDEVNDGPELCLERRREYQRCSIIRDSISGSGEPLQYRLSAVLEYID